MWCAHLLSACVLSSQSLLSSADCMRALTFVGRSQCSKLSLTVVAGGNIFDREEKRATCPNLDPAQLSFLAVLIPAIVASPVTQVTATPSDSCQTIISRGHGTDKPFLVPLNFSCVWHPGLHATVFCLSWTKGDGCAPHDSCLPLGLLGVRLKSTLSPGR